VVDETLKPIRITQCDNIMPDYVRIHNHAQFCRLAWSEGINTSGVVGQNKFWGGAKLQFFRQTGANFQQTGLLVLKILIVALNSPKWGFPAQNIVFLNENFPTG